MCNQEEKIFMWWKYSEKILKKKQTQFDKNEKSRPDAHT